MTLAEQILALCEEHGLASIDIGCIRYEGGDISFLSYAQAIHGGERLCGSGKHGEDPSAAMVEAIETLNAKRVKSVAVPELAAA